MQDATATQGNPLDDDTAPTPRGAGAMARQWSKHLLSLTFPLTSLGFLATGPHPWYLALPFVLPIFISLVLDIRSAPEERAPDADAPAWAYDLLLLMHTAIQLTNMVLLVRLFSVQSLLSLDTFVCMFVVGSTSGYSAIVVAHEFIHRVSPWQRQVGRLLLCTVMYEHFYTEHVRGHHPRVGTPEDPATARFGERFWPFFRRTVPAQFRSAWRLEAKRLGDADMRPWDPRILRSRVLHGLIVEWGLAFAILAYAGVTAFVVYLLQALWAVRLLETVNYFEHWGLSRTGKRVEPMHSWDTHSAFTYYSLTGLSRHADHHAYASRPYQQLRTWPQSPKLPRGYIGMVPLVLRRNERFQRVMTAELKRRKLGPFGEHRNPEMIIPGALERLDAR